MMKREVDAYKLFVCEPCEIPSVPAQGKAPGRISRSCQTQQDAHPWAGPQIPVPLARCWPSSWRQVLCRETPRLSPPREAPVSIWEEEQQTSDPQT